MAMEVSLVSPERILYQGQAEMVIARTDGGDIAFLTGHAPFLGALGIGPVRIRPTEGSGSGEVLAAVHGGFVEVSNDRVTILSDVAERPENIDVERARRAKETAEAALRQDPDSAEAADALRRADLRLEVASRS